MLSKSTEMQTSALSTEERQCILDENIRLHRDTAKHYDTVHPHMRNSFEQHMQREDIVFMLDAVRNRREVVYVLDVGCGTGNLTMQFLAHGCMVTGIDMSVEMIEVLKAKLDQARVLPAQIELLVTDIDSFLEKSNLGPYDIISMSSVAHHLPDYLTTLHALCERITEEGFLYLVHEPAHKKEVATGHQLTRKLWSVLPRGLDRIGWFCQKVMRRATLDWFEQDTTYADYHYHLDGISVSQIEERLRPLGFALISYSRYNAHLVSLASWVDNVWLEFLRYEQFQRTYFRAIYRRSAGTDRLRRFPLGGRLA